MNPRKQKRIEEMLRREISNVILYELKDPGAGFPTLTGVELSGDQRSAKVKVVAHGSDEERDRTLRTLKRARGYIQGLIGDRLDLRYTPILQFEEDAELQKALRVEKLIDEARRQDREFRDTP